MVSTWCNILTALEPSASGESSLHELDVSNNGLDEEGVLALAQALGKNKTLVLLNLAEVRISRQGIEALIEVSHDCRCWMALQHGYL